MCMKLLAHKGGIISHHASTADAALRRNAVDGEEAQGRTHLVRQAGLDGSDVEAAAEQHHAEERKRHGHLPQ